MGFEFLQTDPLILLFALYGLISGSLELLKLALKKIGRFIVFCRKWRTKYWDAPVDKLA
jgi:hypothetical protein